MVYAEVVLLMFVSVVVVVVAVVVFVVGGRAEVHLLLLSLCSHVERSCKGSFLSCDAFVFGCSAAAAAAVALLPDFGASGLVALPPRVVMVPTVQRQPRLPGSVSFVPVRGPTRLRCGHLCITC